MTEEKLRGRCQYWQRVLRLQDWRVDVRIVGTEELGTQEAGQTEIHQDSKLATIKILDEAAYNQTSRMVKAFHSGYEHTLVHELLHIPFDTLMDREADRHEQIMQEQAIEFIADALIALYRAKSS